ncbi:MAG TPA: dienelactone hydrolase family protein [Steroidobacteraceae bacterium]|nr:dienelactone hydrolase family protein [Steroidobacteraceae bacterium]
MHEVATQTLRIASNEGEFDAYLARPAKQSAAAVVVLHEVFGVNADLRASCDELAAAGFIAISPELFWRQQRSVDLSVRSAADFDLDAGVRDVEAAVAAASQVDGASGRVGVLGFCLGGLLTFLAAARTEVDAAVAFHGGRTEEFLGEADDIDGPLQMHIAGEDEFMSKAAQRAIVAALSDAQRFEVFTYPGCHHAFSRHGGEHFDADAARLSRARTLQFLDQHLNP